MTMNRTSEPGAIARCEGTAERAGTADRTGRPCHFGERSAAAAGLPAASFARRRPSRGGLARSGRRATTGFLLLLAALLALPLQAQAQAPTEVWAGTLTVRDSVGVLGCSYGYEGSYCSDYLSDDDFTHDGTDYVIWEVWLRPNGRLEFTLDKDLTTALEALTLTVDGTAFAFADADVMGSSYRRWNNSGLSWSVGDHVSLRLQLPIVNTAPTASNNTVTANYNMPHVFAAADFNFADADSDSLASVKIVMPPRTGRLTLDGTAVTANQIIRKADIDAGKLVFRPSAGSAGSPYTHFTFKVDDGADESERDYTMFINVPVPPRTEPGAPRNLSGSPGDQQVTLTWGAPSSDGGSTITRYEYEIDDSGVWMDAGTDRRAVVTGLTNGRRYTFAVRAVNAAGGGKVASVTVTPGTGPGAPRNLSGSPGDQQVTLTWDAPSSDGGSTITRYEYEIDHSGAWMDAGTDRRAVVTGLTNGRRYTFAVRAVNAAGGGEVARVTATPFTAPSAPWNLRGVPGDQQVTLTWDAPLSDGASAITRFEYEIDDSGAWMDTGRRAVAVVTGLTNGQRYTFAVRAVNAAGGGEVASVTVTPGTGPGAPRNLSGSPGDQQVTLTWDAPSSDGGSTITRYEYEIDDSGVWMDAGTHRRAVVTGLTNGRRYTFAVRAVNAAGGGEVARVTVTPGTGPGAPRNLSGSPGDQQVTLTWDAPSSDGGSTITRYEYEIDHSGAWMDADTDRRAVVTGLTNGQRYTFAVRAVNAVGGGEAARVRVTVREPALLALFPRASGTVREGFARVINHDGEAGEVSIEAVDDTGARLGPVTLFIEAGETAHFNSGDLEDGNVAKGLSDGVGSGEGDWRLVLNSELDFEALSYIRTGDGFLTAMHDTVPVRDGAYEVAIFNPGSNTNQVSRLRLINPGDAAAAVTVTGIDDAGGSPGTSVEFEIPAGESFTLTASDLEAGAGVDGALGDGTGKWRLQVTSNAPIEAISLLSSPTGHLTNLSTVPERPGDEDGTHVVPLFPSASDPLGRQGFVRVVNRSTEAGAVRIAAYDDSDFDYEDVTLSIAAGATVHFNSNDLELGNAAKGLSGSTGAGVGDWRLVLSSELDILVLTYIRTTDGFLTSMHDVAPSLEGVHRVAIFNPGSNPNQVSGLRLVNPGLEDAEVTITGIDDAGASPGTTVVVTIPAGASRTILAAELESGGNGLSGSLGNGVGKWRLQVESDEPIVVMSLLSSPTGHLTNLSTAPDRGGL